MKKRVLLLNTSFCPSIGGVETSLAGIAECLNDKGHEVFVIAGDRSNTSHRQLNDKEFLCGAYVYRYRADGFFARFFSCIKLCLHVKQFGPFELVLSRSHFTNVCARLARLKGVEFLIPALYCHQNSPSFMRGGRLYFLKYLLNCLLEEVSLRGCKKIFVFSDEMRSQVFEKIGKGVDVVKVFPGVDKKRFFPVDSDVKKRLRHSLGIPESSRVLLCMGRLEAVKGIEIAIKAMMDLPRGYSLLVVGNGSHEIFLKSLSKRLGVSGRVLFFDFSESPDVYFKASDVFLMTSLYEPLGQVVIESLSCGVCVVAPMPSFKVRTAAYEVFEEIGGGVFFCEKWDPTSLAAKVVEFFDKPSSSRVAFDRSWGEVFFEIKNAS